MPPPRTRPPGGMAHRTPTCTTFFQHSATLNAARATTARPAHADAQSSALIASLEAARSSPRRAALSAATSAPSQAIVAALERAGRARPPPGSTATATVLGTHADHGCSRPALLLHNRGPVGAAAVARDGALAQPSTTTLVAFWTARLHAETSELCCSARQKQGEPRLGRRHGAGFSLTSLSPPRRGRGRESVGHQGWS